MIVIRDIDHLIGKHLVFRDGAAYLTACRFRQHAICFTSARRSSNPNRSPGRSLPAGGDGRARAKGRPGSPKCGNCSPPLRKTSFPQHCLAKRSDSGGTHGRQRRQSLRQTRQEARWTGRMNWRRGCGACWRMRQTRHNRRRRGRMRFRSPAACVDCGARQSVFERRPCHRQVPGTDPSAVKPATGPRNSLAWLGQVRLAWVVQGLGGGNN